MIIWPSSLPQLPTKNYSEDNGVLILRTPMDAGPAKQRYRGKRASNLQVQYEMSTSQVQELAEFVEDTTMGVKRYQITHPRTGLAVEVRMIPQQDGKLYDITMVSTNVWNVSIGLEVLP